MTETPQMESASGSKTQKTLDDNFSRAADRVVLYAVSADLPSEVQLDLYGLYKQSTKGACKEFRPSFFDIKARTKWAAWKKLETISPTTAKRRYVELVHSLFPEKNANEEAASRGGMRPVFSTLKESDAHHDDDTLATFDLHQQATLGNLSRVIRLLEHGGDVDARDSDGCCALHWAADRGHLAVILYTCWHPRYLHAYSCMKEPPSGSCNEVVKELLSRGSQPDATDCDGQSPLHYAALCGRQQVAKCLLEAGADPSLRNAFGQTPSDIAISQAECYSRAANAGAAKC